MRAEGSIAGSTMTDRSSPFVRFVDRPSGAALVRVGLAAIAAVLHALCFPPFDLGWLGWAALVPLAFAVRGLRARHAAGAGWLYGLLSAHLVFFWIFRFEAFTVVHGLLLGGYLALYPALVAVALSRWAFTTRGLLLVPAATAAIEWARAHAGFLAVPWASFAQTQHADVPLLQLAAYGGEPLVGIVVVLANVAIAQVLVSRTRTTKIASGCALAAAVLAHVAGLARLEQAVEGREVTVAAVQPSILPNERDSEHADEHFGRLAKLTREARASGAELVVWPETAVGSIQNDLETKLAIRDVVQDIGAPIVFGSSEIEKLGKPAARASGGTERARSFNAAFVMEPGKPVPEPYLKVRLLPFAEYRPLDLPEWLAPRMFETERGARHLPLRTDAILVEPIICWENLFADEVRATASDEPSVIAHLVNDAWFGKTAQPELHNLVSAFRAAESGRPLVIASNTGPSWIIDARGRVVARTPSAFEPAFVTATVRAPAGQTPYRRWGDWTWIVPLLASLATMRVFERRRGSPIRSAA